MHHSIFVACWAVEFFLMILKVFFCSLGSRYGGLEGSVWRGSWDSVRGWEKELDQFSAGCGPQFRCFLPLPGQCWPRQTGKHPLLVLPSLSHYSCFMFYAHLYTPHQICLLLYSGKKNNLSPCWFFTFAHWQRNDQSINLMGVLF